MSNEAKELYEFGPYRLDPEKRLLFRGAEPVSLQMKAFETLLALVRHSEEVVLKDDLMKAVWPDTFVEESNLTQNISVLRKTLGDDAGERRYIVTVPGRGYRFIEKVRSVPREEVVFVESHARSRVVITEGVEPNPWLPMLAGDSEQRLSRKLIFGGLAGLILVGVLGSYLYARRSPKLTTKDTIVLGDFSNTTGDPVFDDTLRQGLAAQLEQSPFLSLLSDRRVAQTLTLMSKPLETRLIPDVAREVCQRSRSTAVLNGSIAQIGTRYLLTLKGVSCSTGDSLASTSVQARDKDHVLDALGKAAAGMRKKLGESLASVQKYDVPLQDVTTSSLDALQAYSLGQRSMNTFHDGFKALSFYQRAIELDPSFASAYARIGVSYFNSGQRTRASEYLEKAYALRERLSEPERFYIEAHHADIVVGDVQEARKIYEMWSEIYPRDPRPLNGLGVICEWVGDYDACLKATQAGLKLDPDDKTGNNNLVGDLVKVGRVPEARAAATDLVRRYPDEPVIHGLLYDIDFLENDTAGMQQEVAWRMGKPGWEDWALRAEAATAAYSGHFVQARDLVRRAVNSVSRIGSRETAARYYADAAVSEALVGNVAAAKQLTKNALALTRDQDVDATPALACALTGDLARSNAMVDEISRKLPKDVPMQFGVLPEVRAAGILSRDPRKAIDILDVTIPYEYGWPLLYPAYFRGYAYIATRQGSAAVTEFEKIIDHPGIIQNNVIGSLAHLGLGRAYVVAGDSKKAKAEYDNFLTLWKDADADIPILKQARSEFAHLP
jgi:eukaryotic-like serine/threonine-protein kinase